MAQSIPEKLKESAELYKQLQGVIQEASPACWEKRELKGVDVGAEIGAIVKAITSDAADKDWADAHRAHDAARAGSRENVKELEKAMAKLTDLIGKVQSAELKGKLEGVLENLNELSKCAEKQTVSAELLDSTLDKVIFEPSSTILNASTTEVPAVFGRLAAVEGKLAEDRAKVDQKSNLHAKQDIVRRSADLLATVVKELEEAGQAEREQASQLGGNALSDIRGDICKLAAADSSKSETFRTRAKFLGDERSAELALQGHRGTEKKTLETKVAQTTKSIDALSQELVGVLKRGVELCNTIKTQRGELAAAEASLQSWPKVSQGVHTALKTRSESMDKTVAFLTERSGDLTKLAKHSGEWSKQVRGCTDSAYKLSQKRCEHIGAALANVTKEYRTLLKRKVQDQDGSLKIHKMDLERAEKRRFALESATAWGDDDEEAAEQAMQAEERIRKHVEDKEAGLKALKDTLKLSDTQSEPKSKTTQEQLAQLTESPLLRGTYVDPVNDLFPRPKEAAPPAPAQRQAEATPKRGSKRQRTPEKSLQAASFAQTAVTLGEGTPSKKKAKRGH